MLRAFARGGRVTDENARNHLHHLGSATSLSRPQVTRRLRDMMKASGATRTNTFDLLRQVGGLGLRRRLAPAVLAGRCPGRIRPGPRIGGSWYQPDAQTLSAREFAARHSNLGKVVRQMQRYMARNTDEPCLDTVRPETPLTGCHDHQFEDGSDADPEMEK